MKIMPFLPFIITVLENAFGLLLAVWLIPQWIPGSIMFTGGWMELAFAGLVIGLINGILKPIIKLFSFPLHFLTAGLFGIVSNIALLWLADYFLPTLQIPCIVPLLLTSFVLGIVHFIL